MGFFSFPFDLFGCFPFRHLLSMMLLLLFLLLILLYRHFVVVVVAVAVAVAVCRLSMQKSLPSLSSSMDYDGLSCELQKFFEYHLFTIRVNMLFVCALIFRAAYIWMNLTTLDIRFQNMMYMLYVCGVARMMWHDVFIYMPYAMFTVI